MTRFSLGVAVAAAVLLSAMPSVAADEDPAALLHTLDATLEMKSAYEQAFLQRVDAMKDLLAGADAPQVYELNKRIAGEYLTYNSDSALAYYEANRRLARMLQDPYRQVETDLLEVRAYVKAGYTFEALERFSRYPQVPSGLEALHALTGSMLYGEVAAYAPTTGQWWDLRNAYLDSCQFLLPPDSYALHNVLRQQAESRLDPVTARSEAEQMRSLSTVLSRDYAEACFFLSLYETDEDRRLCLLIRSAIADFSCATRDYAALNEVAEMLYNRGDIDRAFRYAADHCMPDAIFYGGKLRPWQIAQFFPSLEKAYEAMNRRNRARLLMLVLLSFVLLAALGVALSYLFRRNRLLDRTRQQLELSKADVEGRNAALHQANRRLQEEGLKLQESNKVRQTYIALFLQNLSENISTTRQYKNHVLRYLRLGNEKALIEEIEALPPLEEDIQEFNRMFDRTFVNLYPDFVEKFNALLTEEAAIVPRSGDILTPELRVFALIKLGISDSSKIASLLHYSANTIYNYRAKTKNRARGDRDRFEDAVRAIE